MSKNIFGFFISEPSLNYTATVLEEEESEEKGRQFRGYIWGSSGIEEKLDGLFFNKYGGDLELILFQFYLEPLNEELSGIHEIENYRKREKSIGISVIVDSSFFLLSDSERMDFLKTKISQRLELLEKSVQKNQLDTNMILLKSDVSQLLN